MSPCIQLPSGFGDNGSGQLGDGSIISSTAGVAMNLPDALHGLAITAIAAGDSHSLILTATGRVYSFGSNNNGQLGSGKSLLSSVSLVEVDASGVLAGETITAISAGSFHSLVLSATGQVFSFGDNLDGQLGDGTWIDRNFPVAVNKSGVLNGHIITAISAGGFHSLVLSETGQVFSFGYNNVGQLGDGTPIQKHPLPVALNTTGVLSGHNFTAIAGGNIHSLVLSATGQVFSFGSNTKGQLGDGTQISSRNPVAVVTSTVLLGHQIIAIAAHEHSLVLSETGQVFSFGSNTQGQLGDGTAASRTTPVAVFADDALSGHKVVAIAAGHEYSLVLTENGQAFSFGDRPSIKSPIPIAVNTSGVLSGHVVTAIAAGRHFLVLSTSSDNITTGEVRDGAKEDDPLLFQSATNKIAVNWDAFISIDSNGQNRSVNSYDITMTEKQTGTIVFGPWTVTFPVSQPVFSFEGLTKTSLLHNMTYFTTISAHYCKGATESSIGFLFDDTPPMIGEFRTMSDIWPVDENLTIEWTDIEDPESGIAQIEIIVIDGATNSSFGCNKSSSGTFGQLNLTWSECGVYLPAAMPLKILLKATNGAGLTVMAQSGTGFGVAGVRLTKLEPSNLELKACRAANVEWTSLGLNGTFVAISLVGISSNDPIANITDEPIPVEQNRFEWQPVPETATPGQYRIKLISLFREDTDVISLSQNFSIESADACITIVSPNENTKWMASEVVRFEWKSSGIALFGNMNLELLHDGHVVQLVDSAPQIIAGQLNWTLPETLPPDTTYRVRASAASVAGVVFLTRPFEIVPIPPSSTSSSTSERKSSTTSSPSSGTDEAPNDFLPVIVIGGGVLLIFFFLFMILVVILAIVLFIVVLQRRHRQQKGDPQQQQTLETEDRQLAQPSSKVHIEYNALEIPIKELGVLDRQGKGSYGIVFKATYQGSSVAVKMLDMNSEGLEDFLKEAITMAQLQHPRLLQFVGVVNDDDKFGIVTEFMERGSLDKLLWRKNAIKLSWQAKMGILIDVASGMAFIHSRGFIHRDLKSPNILIGDSNRAKVGDFGLARTMDKSASIMTDKQGTPLWMAPEVIESTGIYDNKCDVFSFGIIMWEILAEKEPYHDIQNKQSVMFNVARDPNFRPAIPSVDSVMELHSTDGEEEKKSIDKVFEQFVTLMRECWAHDSSSRPSFQQVLERLNDMTKLF